MPLTPQQPTDTAPPEIALVPEGAIAHPLGHMWPTAAALLAVLVEPQQRRAVAAAHIAAGTPIIRLEGRATDTPTRYSVQIAPGEHLDPFDLFDDAARIRWRAWMFLNHSCDPNAAIQDRALIALRDIPEGEGVTFDYNATEWEMAEPFACHCGSPRCVRVVRGARHQRASRP